MLIRDKTGGPLLQAELDSFGGGPTVLVADNGRKQFEIEAKDAKGVLLLAPTTGKIETNLSPEDKDWLPKLSRPLASKGFPPTEPVWTMRTTLGAYV